MYGIFSIIEALSSLKNAWLPQISDFFYLCQYFKSLLQKEITIHHKSNIKTTLNYNFTPNFSFWISRALAT